MAIENYLSRGTSKMIARIIRILVGEYTLRNVVLIGTSLCICRKYGMLVKEFSIF